MVSKSSSLRFSESALESFKPGMSVSGGRITAAATTGPARGPRPASSTPAMCWMPRSLSFFSMASICSRRAFSRACAFCFFLICSAIVRTPARGSCSSARRYASSGLLIDLMWARICAMVIVERFFMAESEVEDASSDERGLI